MASMAILAVRFMRWPFLRLLPKSIAPYLVGTLEEAQRKLPLVKDAMTQRASDRFLSGPSNANPLHSPPIDLSAGCATTDLEFCCLFTTPIDVTVSFLTRKRLKTKDKLTKPLVARKVLSYSLGACSRRQFFAKLRLKVWG